MVYRISIAEMMAVIEQSYGSGSQRMYLPKEIGTGYTDFLNIDHGLTLAYSNYTPKHDLLEVSKAQRENQSLTITIALQGHTICQELQGNHFEFKAGYTTVSAFSRAQAERRCQANQTVRQLRFIVDKSFLHKFSFDHLLQQDEQAKIAEQLFFDSTNPYIGRLANGLIDLYSQSERKIELHIAALSLLSEQYKQIRPVSIVNKTIKQQDEEKILKVVDIMKQYYAQPLTIPYLCATVGINEFKLKQCFQEMFNTSPYRMLTDIRMHEAWQLLVSGERVSTVAHKVGFQHLASFSSAFQKYYGRTPKTISRNSDPIQNNSNIISLKLK